jgi:hypothetical protein
VSKESRAIQQFVVIFSFLAARQTVPIFQPLLSPLGKLLFPRIGRFSLTISSFIDSPSRPAPMYSDRNPLATTESFEFNFLASRKRPFSIKNQRKSAFPGEQGLWRIYLILLLFS